MFMLSPYDKVFQLFWLFNSFEMRGHLEESFGVRDIDVWYEPSALDNF